MADKTLKINVEVGTTNIDALEAKLSKLQTDIKSKGIGTDEFKQLSSQIQEVTKQLEVANNKVQGFTAEKKIMAMDGAIKTLAGTVSGVVGVFGLLGVESDKLGEFEKKAASAIAFGMGIKDVSEGFQQLAKSEALATIGAKLFGNTLKTALVSTGIGALVVALGVIVAYWDDIMAAVSGVSTETQDLLEKQEAGVAAEEAKLTTLNGQDNILKLQGKSEDDIIKLKQKQTKEVIKQLEAQLITQEEIKKAQVDTAKRNAEILQNVIRLVSAPLTLLLAGIDAAGKAFGKDFGLEQGFSGGLAKMVFDPKEVEDEGNKAIDATKKKLAELKNQDAGFTLSLNKSADDRKKKAAEDGKAEADRLKAEAEAKKKAAQDEINTNEALQQSIDELAAARLKKSTDEIQQIRDEEAIKEQAYLREVQRIKDLMALEAVGSNEYKALQTELNNLDATRTAERITAEDNVTAKQKEEQQKRVEAVLAQRDLDLAIKEEQNALDELDFQKREAQYALDTELAIQRSTLERDALLANTELTESQRTGIIDLYAQREQNIKKQAERDELERKRLLEQQKLSVVADGFGALASIFGESSKAGKAFAISQALINTYLGVTTALSTPSVLPQPFATIQKIAAVAISLATGLKAVKQIAATPPMAASAGSGGSASVPAVGGAAMSGAGATPALPAQTPRVPEINPFQTIRAYVLSGDVRSGQEAEKKIELRRTI
jgi:hypothetical protein